MAAVTAPVDHKYVRLAAPELSVAKAVRVMDVVVQVSTVVAAAMLAAVGAARSCVMIMLVDTVQPLSGSVMVTE